LADADRGGEMDHGVDTLQSAPDDIAISYIADDQLGLAGEIRRPAAHGAVNLRRQVIENADAVTAIQQQIRKMRTDKSRTTGYQYTHRRHRCRGLFFSQRYAKGFVPFCGAVRRKGAGKRIRHLIDGMSPRGRVSRRRNEQGARSERIAPQARAMARL